MWAHIQTMFTISFPQSLGTMIASHYRPHFVSFSVQNTTFPGLRESAAAIHSYFAHEHHPFAFAHPSNPVAFAEQLHLQRAYTRTPAYHPLLVPTPTYAGVHARAPTPYLYLVLYSRVHALRGTHTTSSPLGGVACTRVGNTNYLLTTLFLCKQLEERKVFGSPRSPRRPALYFAAVTSPRRLKM